MVQKKYVSFNKLSIFFDGLKQLFATKAEISMKADKSHTHTTSQVTDLQTVLDGAVSTKSAVQIITWEADD